MRPGESYKLKTETLGITIPVDHQARTAVTIPKEPDSDEVLTRFNQLIEELIDRNLHRGSFRPWEIVILVDMVRCDLRGFSARTKILREYQKAVQQHMQDGARVPLKLSEYMGALQVSGNPATKQRALGAHGA
jgi:hypothetical protein